MTTTDIFGRVKTGSGVHFLYGNGFTDGTPTELKVQDIAGSSIPIGEHLAGQSIQELAIMLSDGSILTTAILYAKDGGVVASWRGSERTLREVYNLEAKQLSIALEKGMVLKINTAD